MEPESVTKADFDEIVDRLAAFWGERDLSAMHHPMFIHEFGDSAFLMRDEHGGVAAYLFGFVVPSQALAYVHLVAVRDDQRGRGLARMLYERFERLARERGCDRIKAITTPGNAASIAFHRAIGMDSVEVPDYAGTGRTRVVFSAHLRE
ncbi:MAG: GNAT family N-acetyltransferase [Solirubrobacteraceae bacterium]